MQKIIDKLCDKIIDKLCDYVLYDGRPQIISGLGVILIIPAILLFIYLVILSWKEVLFCILGLMFIILTWMGIFMIIEGLERCKEEKEMD